MPAIERFGVRLADEHVFVKVVVEVGMVNAISNFMECQILHDEIGHLRPKAVVNIPDLKILDDKRVPGVWSDAIDTFAKIDPIEAMAAVDFIVLEALEGERAGVDVLARPIGLANRKEKFQSVSAFPLLV